MNHAQALARAAQQATELKWDAAAETITRHNLDVARVTRLACAFWMTDDVDRVRPHLEAAIKRHTMDTARLAEKTQRLEDDGDILFAA